MIETQTQQALGRAKNAVQEYLIRKLLVPKIYLDAEWGGRRVDVLAVDRAGVGDIHAVLIRDYSSQADEAERRRFLGWTAIPDEPTIAALAEISAHYKYLGLATNVPEYRESKPNVEVGMRVLAPDGVGRAGILIVDFSRPNVSVEEVLRPERFRSSKEVVELADQFVEAHTANWEVRDEPTTAP